MTEILLTASITILGGTFVFVLGNIIVKFFIDPIQKQKETIGEIFDALTYYANIYTSPKSHFIGMNAPQKESYIKTQPAIRRLATLLESKTQMIPWYNLFSRCNVVPPIENIEKAHKSLLGISNSIFNIAEGKNNHLMAMSIRKLLRPQKEEKPK